MPRLVDLARQIKSDEQAVRRVGRRVVHEGGSRGGALRHSGRGAVREPEGEGVPPDFFLNAESIGRAMDTQVHATRLVAVPVDKRRDHLRQQGYGGPDVNGSPHAQRECIGSRQIGKIPRTVGVGREQAPDVEGDGWNEVNLRAAGQASREYALDVFGEVLAKMVLPFD